ncbi:PTS fructose transporter subunit IIC [Salibacterium halotolerans]|uniref:PTS system, fructose-specific IIC component n=1 Tax=Salibacterium halotolerans TaxID=1884432 RepID=A0A1I5X1M8_9BACI|nr:fructose-specific PTS transporter subunit EIIC [Salibacterium halotolerans]SFQ25915.1 PTS system, fructose-specific IIC component [Salibacterium halotolerans]
MKLVGITSCPNGIAHTYMAAEGLNKAAQEKGMDIKVETQGSIGVENELTEEDIEEADGVVIAADKSVEKSRFEGKPVLETDSSEAINNAGALLARFEAGEVETYGAKTGREKANEKIEEEKSKKKKKQNPLYRHLMNGVSYMIPFVVVGGLLIAISLSLGGEPSADGLAIPEGSFWNSINQMGNTAFSLMVPILAGFIAMSIADRPGLAPGMIGGFIANDGSFYGSEAGAGFIGGIIAGFLAGYIAKWIKEVKVPEIIQPIMPILIIPILASLAVGLIFIYVLGAPIAGLMEALTNGLEGMEGGSRILLGLILGAMISFDMGGPFNKVAFLFGAALITQGQPEVMGAIAAAICTPPLGMGLASLIFKRKFKSDEQEAGKAAVAMGLVGITEGAIPLAAADPFRVIPSIMAGGMSAGAIAMMGNVADHVPHGGPIVAVFGAIDNVLMFFVAIIVGTIVTALLANILKKPTMEGS